MINNNQRCDNCTIPMVNKRMNVKYCNDCKEVIKEYNRTLLFVDKYYKRLHKDKRSYLFKKIFVLDLTLDLP